MEEIKLNKGLSAKDITSLGHHEYVTMTDGKPNSDITIQKDNKEHTELKTILNFKSPNKDGLYQTAESYVNKEEYLNFAKAVYEKDPELFGRLNESMKGTKYELTKLEILRLYPEVKIEAQYNKYTSDYEAFIDKHKDQNEKMDQQGKKFSERFVDQFDRFADLWRYSFTLKNKFI